MLAARYDALLFDLDGVVYRGDDAVEGAPETLDAVRDAGASVVFLTNNSSRTPERVAEKLVRLGIEAAPDEVMTSAVATADMLALQGGGTAYVIGGEGVTRALQNAGIAVVDGEPPRVDLVVVGIDDDFTYARLRTASVLVQRGARLVATNADRTFPATRGELWPGAGALVAALEVATGVAAEVVGKPHAPLFEAALRRSGGSTPLVIGDRLDTDIAGANALGWDSMLVLSGVSTEVELGDSPFRPTYVAPDVRGLLEDGAVERVGGGNETGADQK
jgi:HAD superfamily hydrolase (TIGR01457 family)